MRAAIFSLLFFLFTISSLQVQDVSAGSVPEANRGNLFMGYVSRNEVYPDDFKQNFSRVNASQVVSDKPSDGEVSWNFAFKTKIGNNSNGDDSGIEAISQFQLKGFKFGLQIVFRF